MDASKLETFTLTINKRDATHTDVSLNAKAKPETDLVALWGELRPQICAHPSLAGCALVREDMNLALQRLSINGPMFFETPKADAAAK